MSFPPSPLQSTSGTILFVAADPRECGHWAKHWDSCREVSLPVHWARAGVWNGRSVLAIANGAGAGRAYQAVKAALGSSGSNSLGAVCSIGFCGALDESLRAGDVVLVSEVRSQVGAARTRLIPAFAGANQNTGEPRVLLTVDHIVRSAKEKHTLRASGASVVEMEAAGVARAAAESAIPFYCVRVVSDASDEELLNDFGAALQPDGTFSLPRLLWGALGSPVARFGELIRLGRRTAEASKNLGDFLANCSF